MSGPASSPGAPSPSAPSGGDASGARIVVGVDGSPSSIIALRWAHRVGSALELAIDAVSCWEFPAEYGVGLVPVAYDPEVDVKRALENSLVTAFGDSRPAGLRASTHQGHPAKVLIQLSSSADMLVVGSRGHGGFVGLLIGSVSAHCAEHGICPVVVVHDVPVRDVPISDVPVSDVPVRDVPVRGQDGPATG